MEDSVSLCHYTPFYSFLEGGIKTSVKQQKKALKKADMDFAESLRDDFRILHLNYFDPLSIAAFFKTRYFSGKKVVFHSHVTGEDFKDSMRFSNLVAPLVGAFTLFFYRRADKVIAPSEYTKGLLKEKNVEDIEVVSNGIDTERLQETGTPVEELEEKYQDSDFTAIQLGLVFERKGLTDFIETAEKMPETDFTWFGPSMNKVLSRTGTRRKMKTSPSNVKFPGFIEDINDAFKLADVFFFPTHEENQGISLLEAAYKGLPIVVRDIGTYDGWLEHEKHCLKADDPEGFKEQIQRLKQNPELREKIGENARQMAEQHTLDKIGEKLKKVYEKV
ncbi:MAG: glycosyltransferase family 4 protein [Candidatus Nanohalobium sp.]